MGTQHPLLPVILSITHSIFLHIQQQTSELTALYEYYSTNAQ